MAHQLGAAPSKQRFGVSVPRWRLMYKPEGIGPSVYSRMFFIEGGIREMVAGTGIAPVAPAYETDELLLLYPAMAGTAGAAPVVFTVTG